jgi:hypothetical protein
LQQQQQANRTSSSREPATTVAPVKAAEIIKVAEAIVAARKAERKAHYNQQQHQRMI